MDFSKVQYKRINNSFRVSGNAFLCLITLMISFSSLTAQEFSLNNYICVWTDNDSWLDGTAPNTGDIKINISIYYNIHHFGNIFFNNGDLHVYDTLVIFENLSLGNNANYLNYSGGILIARGDSVS